MADFLKNEEQNLCQREKSEQMFFPPLPEPLLSVAVSYGRRLQCLDSGTIQQGTYLVNHTMHHFTGLPFSVLNSYNLVLAVLPSSQSQQTSK